MIMYMPYPPQEDRLQYDNCDTTVSPGAVSKIGDCFRNGGSQILYAIGQSSQPLGPVTGYGPRETYFFTSESPSGHNSLQLYFGNWLLITYRYPTGSKVVI